MIFLSNDLSALVNKSIDQAQPTAGFSRVIHKASINHFTEAQITGAEVLSELFIERESYAVFFLSEQNITQIDIVNALAQKLVKEQYDKEAMPSRRIDMLAEPAHYNNFYFNNKANKDNNDINKKILHNKDNHQYHFTEHNRANNAASNSAFE